MNRGLFYLFLLVASASAADHVKFLDCARVSFCNKLRTATPDGAVYFADLNTLRIFGGIANVELHSQQSFLSLNLQITPLTNSRFRVIIQELTNPTRYHLQDVLDGEPEQAYFDSSSHGDGFVELAESADSSVKVVILSNPLTIQFIKDGVVETVINGDRMIFEDDEESEVFTFGVSFPESSRLYGLHEHAHHLPLVQTEPNGEDPYRLRNLDVAYYDVNSTMSLYGAVPVLYGHGSNSTSGVFLHNAAEQWIEITRNEGVALSAYFMVESGVLDLFVLLGPTPKDVVRQYASLTGVSHLPQLWALGYHQSRYNYDNTSDVKDVIANFDKADIPVDSIWLDIEYTDEKKYFTWDPVAFSDPVEMQQNLSSTNRKLVTIIDPHIKVDNDYFVYAGGLESDIFVKNPNGSNFEGECWPGLSSYIDFLNPEARNYYASLHSYENFKDSTETLAGIWNDMNEPSVFDDSIEQTLPGDTLHIGDVKHKVVHNIYGFLQTKATHQGLMERDNGEKRPFILTRSHFAGSQRYAAFWTGDNAADWNYLAISYPECLNANILGIPFCGADVGGFFGNPSEELLQRWYQAGAWLPFFRAHSTIDTDRREPYLFPDEIRNVLRNAIIQRYQHISVWYTLFYEHTRYGDPVIRPLFYHYPDDENVLDIENQLLAGKDILVRAIMEPDVDSVEVYFPGQTDYWYSVEDSQVIQGGSAQSVSVDINSIPVYYRAGSIIARKDRERLSTTAMQNDPYHLFVNLNEDLYAEGTLYIDDFTSFKYTESLEEFTYVKITFENSSLEITPVDPDQNLHDIYIGGVVVNDLTKLSNGQYTRTMYTKSAEGVPLVDIFKTKSQRILKIML